MLTVRQAIQHRRRRTEAHSLTLRTRHKTKRRCQLRFAGLRIAHQQPVFPALQIPATRHQLTHQRFVNRRLRLTFWMRPFPNWLLRIL